MPDTAIRKYLQRHEGISARKELEKGVAQLYSRIISEKLIADPTLTGAKTILSYQAYAGEADPSVFNEHALREGKRLAFPICYGDGLMTAALPNTAEDWETGKYGIRAPIESRSSLLDPLEIDLVIVPCTAFDGLTRMRIGWGAGYYDRYLPQCRNAICIAIAYEVQHIRGLCQDEWDVPLNAVVTEFKRY